MTRRGLLGLAGAATLRGWTGDSLGAARDLVYQALECLSEKASPEQVKQAIRFLRGALDQYPSFGDAFYFRGLCLKHQGLDPTRDLAKASEYQSANGASGKVSSKTLLDLRRRDVVALRHVRVNDHCFVSCADCGQGRSIWSSANRGL